jgi:hypothetical protein
MPRQRVSTFAGVSYLETSRCAVCGDPTWTSTESPDDTRHNLCTRDDCPRSHTTPTPTLTPAAVAAVAVETPPAPAPEPAPAPYGHDDAEVIDRDA